LKAFRRISLKAGESRTLSFSLGCAGLGFYNARLQFVVEPGDFTVAAGGGLDALLETNLRIIG